RFFWADSRNGRSRAALDGEEAMHAPFVPLQEGFAELGGHGAGDDAGRARGAALPEMPDTAGCASAGRGQPAPVAGHVRRLPRVALHRSGTRRIRGIVV